MLTRRELFGLLRPGAGKAARAPAAPPQTAALPDEAAGRAGAPSVSSPGPWASRRASTPRLPLSMVPAVVSARCLASRSFCTVCVERCPAPGAIALRVGQPVIDPARCDGCGQCLAACPAPVLALTLVPR